MFLFSSRKLWESYAKFPLYSGCGTFVPMHEAGVGDNAGKYFRHPLTYRLGRADCRRIEESKGWGKHGWSEPALRERAPPPKKKKTRRGGFAVPGTKLLAFARHNDLVLCLAGPGPMPGTPGPWKNLSREHLKGTCQVTSGSHCIVTAFPTVLPRQLRGWPASSLETLTFEIGSPASHDFHHDSKTIFHTESEERYYIYTYTYTYIHIYIYTYIYICMYVCFAVTSVGWALSVWPRTPRPTKEPREWSVAASFPGEVSNYFRLVG